MNRREIVERMLNLLAEVESDIDNPFAVAIGMSRIHVLAERLGIQAIMVTESLVRVSAEQEQPPCNDPLCPIHGGAERPEFN